MRCSVLRSLAALVVMAGSFAAVHANAQTISSSSPGYSPFVNDNDVQLFSVKATFPLSRFTLFTDSYAAPGLNGFPTALSLFTDTGNAASDVLVGQSLNDNGTNDALLNAVVPSGNYLVALTQHDNTALGPNRSAGYTFNNAFFSDPLYTGGPFTDFNGVNRTGAWRINIRVISAVPEPGSLALLATGMLTLSGTALLRRCAGIRKNHGKNRRENKGQSNG